jgi:hypothetical protein
MSHIETTPSDVAALPQSNPFGELAPVNAPPATRGSLKTAANPFGGLVVKGFGTSVHFEVAERETPPSGNSGESAPLPPVPPSDLRSEEEGVPLPPRRPNELLRPTEEAPPAVARLEPQAPPIANPSPSATPNVLQRLFGGVTEPSPVKTPEAKLAYAPPPPPSVAGSQTVIGRGGVTPGGGFGGFLRGLSFGSSPTSRFGDHVAVYDISARVVYLPDGTKIEAHSGLGDARDDPSKVSERMRGPTPPATYALTPREELFHGVAALRLTPVDSNIYGRAGLLAHTYMLGAEGDSNGCVSFRDYDAFLRAYRSGEINKLVVVTRL